MTFLILMAICQFNPYYYEMLSRNACLATTMHVNGHKNLVEMIAWFAMLCGRLSIAVT